VTVCPGLLVEIMATAGYWHLPSDGEEAMKQRMTGALAGIRRATAPSRRARPASWGVGPLQALYRAADGWFYLGADKSQFTALASIDGLGGIEALTGDALMAALDARFLSATVDAWCERLVARGIGAHRLVGMPELMTDPWVIAHGLSVTREHDTGEVITTVGPSVRMSGTPADVGRVAASPGADGLEVLASIGLADQAEQLAATGAFWREPVPVE
jgi:crotonobetainyl-CoA:carnitine CoA-transferase CaiB-like acyl-CoA transferase